AAAGTVSEPHVVTRARAPEIATKRGGVLVPMIRGGKLSFVNRRAKAPELALPAGGVITAAANLPSPERKAACTGACRSLTRVCSVSRSIVSTRGLSTALV